MSDPYVYPGTQVLRNKLGLRNAADLRSFEAVASFNRLVIGIPHITMTASGYRKLHRHIFQDIYDWAGKYRTVDLAKGGSQFCRPQFISSEMDRRFELIRTNAGKMRSEAQDFAEEAARHMAELNAIHPFRDGNGRTNRTFLKVLGKAHGHEIDLTKIDPKAWIAASRESFAEPGDVAGFRAIIAGCLLVT